MENRINFQPNSRALIRLLYILTTALLLFIASCPLTGMDMKSDIVIIDINTTVQVFSPHKVLERVENTVRIVSSDNRRLYIIPRMKVEKQNIVDKDGKIVGTKGVYTDTSYIAFAWNVGDTLGLKYSNLDKFKSENPTIVRTDSIFSSLGLTDENFTPINIDLPSPSSVIKNGNKKIEKYPIEKVKVNGVDSIYRYYDKSLRGIDFSFSKKLDNLNDSKLCKIAFIWNKIPKGVMLPDADVPRREAIYEMVIGSDKNMNRLKELFKKAKSDRKLKLGLE